MNRPGKTQTDSGLQARRPSHCQEAQALGCAARNVTQRWASKTPGPEKNSADEEECGRVSQIWFFMHALVFLKYTASEKPLPCL